MISLLDATTDPNLFAPWFRQSRDVVVVVRVPGCAVR